MAKGIMIIPEGFKDKKCKEVGHPFEVSHINLLKEMIGYADRRGCVILYLTSFYGIVSSESVIGSERIGISEVGNERIRKWNMVIGEEIVRSCIEYNTRKVFLMCKEFYKYQKLISEVKGRGVALETPLLGKNEKLRKEILSS